MSHCQMIDIWDGLDVSRTRHAFESHIKPHFLTTHCLALNPLLHISGVMEISIATFAHGSFKVTRSGQGDVQDSATNGSDDPKKDNNIKDLVRRSRGDTYVREY